MKRTGFRKKTLEEVIAKQNENRKKKVLKNKSKKNTKLKRKKKLTKKKVSSYKGIKNTKRWAGADGWRGMFWTIFSMYIRKRDFIKYGRCVSCGSIPEHWRYWDAGHYVSVSNGNADTHYSEKNVHGQCKKCNNPKWTPDSSIPFRIELINRIGEEEINKLERIRMTKVSSKEPTKREYQAMTEKYYKKYKEL
jgi:hypothetical protein